MTVNSILWSLPSNHFKDLDNTFGTLPLSNPATLHKTGWHHAFALDLSYFFAQCVVYKFLQVLDAETVTLLLFDATRSRNILLTKEYKTSNYPQ